MKYQMRGLGAGIMVTALLMGVATGKGIPLSDAEIRAKALELGMVERESLKLTDLNGGTSASGVDASGESNAAAEVDGTGEPGDVSGTEALNESGAASDGESLNEPDSRPEQGSSVNAGSDIEVQNGEAVASGEDGSGSVPNAVTVEIEFGVTSAHVSEILEGAGLIEDAVAFDTYLCNNGYSRKITAGIYEILPGTSEEEIIQIITKSR